MRWNNRVFFVSHQQDGNTNTRKPQANVHSAHLTEIVCHRVQVQTPKIWEAGRQVCVEARSSVELARVVNIEAKRVATRCGLLVDRCKLCYHNITHQPARNLKVLSMTKASTLGSLLRQRRAALDLTQEAAAEQVGCAVDTFRAFESGIRRPSLAMAERLAAALQIPEAEQAAFLQIARAVPTPGRNQLALGRNQPAELEAPRLAAGAPLPLPVAGLMGREEELAQVADRLRQPACRLLTLAGPGGVGKSRLALQIAHDLQGAAHFPDGIVWVSLAPVATAGDAELALAAALGVTLRAGPDVAGQLGAVLAPKRLLLVVDNLEHVLAVATLLDQLLRQAPRLRVLATSRERLRLQAEWVYELGGLAVTAGRSAPIAPATLLFLERARQMTPDFRLTAEHHRAVEAICRELAGVPLAIELAAAWTAVLTPAEIAAEVRRDLHFLTVDDPLVAPQQRSLRTVFARSWALLSPWEQAVCARLALFRGGCTREAAAALVADVADAPPGGLLPALAALVRKSLVRRVVGPQGTSRYELHELVRQFALEELGRDPAALEAARRRHAGYFLALMQQWAAALQGVAPATGRDDLTPEVDNLRLAWNWAVDQCDIAALSQSSTALIFLWNLRDWFQDALVLLGANAAQLRARLHSPVDQPELAHAYALVLSLQGFFYMRANKLVEARAVLGESIAVYAEPRHLAVTGARRVLALTEGFLGNTVEARQLSEQDVAQLRTLEEPFQLGVSLIYCAIIAWIQGDFATARAACNEAFTATPIPGEPRNYALALNFLAAAVLAEGELAEAVALAQQALAVSSSVADRFNQLSGLALLSRAALLGGEIDEARYLHQEAMELARQANDHWSLTVWQTHYAQLAAAYGDTVTATTALREAAPLALADKNFPAVLAAAQGLARLLARQGDQTAAAQLLALVSEHPSAMGETRALAAKLREELSSAMSPEAWADAAAVARSLPLERQISAALRALRG